MLSYRPMADLRRGRTLYIPLLTLLLHACATPPALEPESDTSTPHEHSTASTVAVAEAKPPNASQLKKPIEPAAKNGSLSLQADAPDEEVENDLWKRLRAEFRLPVTYDHPRVQYYLRWHREHPSYMRRISRRAQPFLYFVVEELKRRDMPYELALLPAVESGYVPLAYSHGRAAGLWQFIPETGRHYGLKQNWWYDGRRDIYASTHSALDYLSVLNKRFDGDWLLTLAAYNAGPLRVMKAIERNERRDKPTDYWHLNLPRETRNYVPKLLATRAVIENPQANGIQLWPIANRPAITTADTESQIELALAAEMAVMDVEELCNLNAGFNRWATDPDGPHRLVLPIDKVARFKERLAQLPPQRRMVWYRHNIQTGDTLGAIARKYSTSVDNIIHANQLPNTRIVAGKHLLVPKRNAAEIASLTHAARLDGASTIQWRRKHHTIKRGDTLWSISQRHDVSLQELIDWNELSPNQILIAGDRLVINQPVTTKPDTSPTLSTAVTSKQRYIRTISYSVKSGDSLYGIARRFNVSVADLMRWNKLSNARLLHPGQTVKVRVDITRQSSDS